jgi:hypothetical protein
MPYSIGHRILLTAAAVGAIAWFACRRPEGERSADVNAPVVRDSMGVRITDNGRPEQLERWLVHSMPRLRLGDAKDDPQHQFFRIAGIRVLDDGSVVVVDGASREVRRFDAQGKHISTIGRRGSGPGEYEAPVLVPAASDNVLLVYDLRRRRFASFTQELRPASEQMNVPGLQGRPVGVTGERILTASVTTVFPVAEGLIEPPGSVVYSVMNLSTGQTIVLNRYEAQRFHAIRDAGGTFAMFDLPFDIAPSAAAGPDRFYIYSGAGSDILVYSQEGAGVGVIRTATRGVSQRDFTEFLDARVRSAPSHEVAGLYRDLYPRLPRPSALPLFEHLITDDMGWLWGKVYAPDPDKGNEWWIYDDDGVLRASAHLPLSLRLHHAGADFIAGVWLDADGVEFVDVYGLVRNGGCRNDMNPSHKFDC